MHFFEGADDPHLPLEEIQFQVLPLQPDELAPATAKVDRRIDEGPEKGSHVFDELLDFFGLEVQLLSMLDAGEGHLSTRRLRNQALIDGFFKHALRNAEHSLIVAGARSFARRSWIHC